MTDDERAIREVVDVWLAASKAGDLATVLSLMTDDVIFMVPGQRPFGKEAFAAASQGMKDVRIEGTSDIQEIQVLGDWAYLRNYLEMTVTPPGGAAKRRSRLYSHGSAQRGRRAMAACARCQSPGGSHVMLPSGAMAACARCLAEVT